MRGKQILARAIENHKENWVSTFFFLLFRDNEATIINSKIQSFLFSFQIEGLLSLENAWLSQIFFFDTKRTL